ncbi:MAG: Hsp20/alpha crystallin family protein [Alphaproteobacteria bacterium]
MVQIQTTNKQQRPAKTAFQGLADPFERLQDEMDRIFSPYLRSFHWPRLGFTPTDDGVLLATLDVSETPETVQIVADVPGIKEKDLDITLNDHFLTLKGRRESESEEKRKNYHRVERSYGEFQRRVALPCEVDADHVDAKLKDGVLTITLPKSVKAMEQVKKITVKAG